MLESAFGKGTIDGVLEDRYQWGMLAFTLFGGGLDLNEKPKHMPIGEGGWMDG